MRKGTPIGGKIITPIREMLESSSLNAVIFRCENEQAAESTRLAALMARRRNDYEFKTTRRGSQLIAYVGEGNYEPLPIVVDLRKD